jgi:AmmeMemoRadiSam system protein A
VAVALEVLAGRDDVEGVQLGYTTSGQVVNDWTNSVSYAAIVLCAGAASPLTAAEQQCLLRLARDQVRLFLKEGKIIAEAEKAYPLTPRLTQPGAAFVTLTNRGDLRGCIGHLVAVQPLYLSVINNAIAACRDSRFAARPVTAEEEPKLHIEISVLSRPRQIAGVQEIQVGRDGLIIERGPNRGLLLPQVPVQEGWDLEQYLAGLCRKAGLPPEAWKDPAARISRFAAQVFAEPAEEKKK